MGVKPIFCDERRHVLVAGNAEQALSLASDHILYTAKQALKKRPFFTWALSGGSTPKALFERITRLKQDSLDWQRTLLFWSDERSCPPDHPDSNFRMAWEAGLKEMKIPSDHIFRMQAESELAKNALIYEQYIQKKVDQQRFDLIMLGMGEDGHTASLFPHNAALEERERLIVTPHVEQKKTDRMSMTFKCINQARNTVVHIFGKNKSAMVKEIFTREDLSTYPIQGVGSLENPALFLLDQDAALGLPF
jgi:6-phosphogluconolactonase